jgi:hypothetical protein
MLKMSNLMGGEERRDDTEGGNEAWMERRGLRDITAMKRKSARVKLVRG